MPLSQYRCISFLPKQRRIAPHTTIRHSLFFHPNFKIFTTIRTERANIHEYMYLHTVYDAGMDCLATKAAGATMFMTLTGTQTWRAIF